MEIFARKLAINQKLGVFLFFSTLKIIKNRKNKKSVIKVTSSLNKMR